MVRHSPVYESDPIRVEKRVNMHLVSRVLYADRGRLGTYR